MVFSDYEPHTDVTIRLTDYYTRAGFRNAIDNSPHFQYRTRIDLALQLVLDDVFTKKNGESMIRNMEKKKDLAVLFFLLGK